MKFYFHPLDKKCKNKTGAIAEGEELTLNVFADGGQNCFLDLNQDGQPAEAIPMQKTPFGWTVTLKINQTGLYFYRFILDGTYIGRDKDRQAQFNSELAYQLTVHTQDFTTPAWFKGGVMYQIFPDRFAKSGENPAIDGRILRSDWGGTPEFRPNAQGIVKNNDFFGGNFKGIIEKLDYLQSLHVTTIYLNPIFESNSNHRYDTGNYKKIDPLLGSKADFERLVAEAKKRGIHVILDGVFNHTGDDSVYFNRYGNYDGLGAYQSQQSPYFDWYNFYAYPNGYDSWWGIQTLPAVNERSQSYQNFIFGEDGVLKHWLKTGIGGYRLDVADELPDFFLKKLRASVKEGNPDALIIGEVWEDATNKVAYGQRREYFHGEELDSIMNYPLKNAIIDYILTGNVEILTQTVAMLLDHYPKCALDCLMNILSTHDTARILTVLGEKPAYNKEQMAITALTDQERKAAIEKVKMAALLQYTLPGVPCVYYGDENAMEGYSDPFCRKCFDWNNLNQDLIGFYQKLGEIRQNAGEAMKTGEYVQIFAKDGCIVFARVDKEVKYYVYLNNGRNKFDISLDGSYHDLLLDREYNQKMEISPYSYGIFRKNR
ncbi:MAG: glycoside hydrolase family 13 protein [Clostridia bacterium]|nr:glycoside hydrolase family 13 protein [Clostridia bacterium]